MGDTSSRERLASVGLALLFLSTIFLPKIVGVGQSPRHRLVAEAILFTIILAGFAILALYWPEVQADRSYSRLLAALLLFNVVAVFAAGIGLHSGFSRLYVVGDLFKFLVPTLAIFGLYFAVFKPTTFRRGFLYAHYVYIVFLLAALTMYVTGILPPNDRLSFLYQYPPVLVIAYWLWNTGHSGGKLTFPLLAVAAIPVIYFTQSLRIVLDIVLLFGITVFFYHGIERRWIIRTLGVGFFGAMLFVVYVSQFGPLTAPETWESAGYLGRKVSHLFRGLGPYELVLRLGGSRGAEPFGVYNEIRSDGILGLLIGSGMGSTFTIHPPTGIQTPVWAGTDHYVHAGLWEALLRTGIIGGALYVVFSLYFFSVTWSIRSQDILCSMACAFAVVNLLFLPIDGTLLGPRFFPFVLLVYVMRKRTVVRSESEKQMRSSLPA